LRESKITKSQRCMKLINGMPLLEKFQCRLDHETAIYLRDHGHGLKSRRSSRGAIVCYSIQETLKTSSAWAEFFIETLLCIWDDLIDYGQYRMWLKMAVCDDGDYRRPKWHRKVAF